MTWTSKQLNARKSTSRALVEEQLQRIELMKADDGWIDYSTIRPLIIGVCGGDGIGPYISRESQRVLEFVLEPEVKSGDVIFRVDRRPDHREPRRPTQGHP